MGLAVEEAAHRAGVSEVRWRRWEEARNAPGPEMRAALALLAGIPPREWLAPRSARGGGRSGRSRVPAHPLRRWRDVRRLGPEEAAERVGASVETWNRWESAAETPPPRLWERLQALTGIDQGTWEEGDRERVA